MSHPVQSPQYGIDAPGLVRFFFTAGVIALTGFLLSAFTSAIGLTLKAIFLTLTGIAVIYLLGMGCLMLYYSKILKLKDREQLLNLILWSGHELVLDVGCGRGLMLIGAAKRLTTGKAIGIDLWQQQDQTNNHSELNRLNSFCNALEKPS